MNRGRKEGGNKEERVAGSPLDDVEEGEQQRQASWPVFGLDASSTWQ